MLKISIDKGEINKIMISGSIVDIAVETAVTINVVHNVLNQNDEDSAEIYKNIIEDMFKKGFLFEDKITFKEKDEREDTIEKKRKEASDIKKNIEKKAQELEKKLKELFGD